MAADLSEVFLVTIDRASPVPVLRQLYLELRRRILAGAIPPGAGCRRPAAWRVSWALPAIPWSAAYEQLLAEGFIEGRVGAGSYVSRDLPEALEVPAPVRAAAPPPLPRRRPPAGIRSRRRTPGSTAPRRSIPAVAWWMTAPCRSGAA